MNKLRWLEMVLPFSLRGLGNKLRTNSFTDDLDEGFLVDRVRDSYVEARFVQKIMITDNVADPSGNERVYERVEYRQTSFIATNEYPQLELIDSPRGIQGFTSRLSEIGELALSIAPIEVDLLRWAGMLQRTFPDHFAVLGAQASGVVMEEGVSARMILTGAVDVRPTLKRVMQAENSGIDKIQLRFENGDLEARIILSADGTARILTENRQEVRDALRGSLSLMHRKAGL